MEKHTTLAGMLEAFRNDESNTPEAGGGRRFDKELVWLEEMVRQYAQKIGVSVDECTALLDAGRDYWWPNYYQPANFPDLEAPGRHFLGYYASPSALRAYAAEHWAGFRCPRCGNVGESPTECAHRIANDGVCDWCAFGLFASPWLVLVRDGNRLVFRRFFEPVPKEVAK